MRRESNHTYKFCIYILLVALIGNFGVIYGQNHQAVNKIIVYAEEYEPKHYDVLDSLSVIPDIPIVDSATKSLLLMAYKQDKKALEKSLMLIVLKTCKAQLLCCRTTYDIFSNGCDERNIISFLAGKYIGKKDINIKMNKTPCPYVTCNDIFLYVKDSPYLMSDAKIRQLCAEIDALQR